MADAVLLREVDEHRADLVPCDDDLGLVVLERRAQLTDRVERVVLHRDGADAHDRLRDDDVLRAARQQDGDAVARRDTEVQQTGRGGVDLSLELVVRRDAPHEVDGRAIAESRDGGVELIDERRRAVVEAQGHTGRVGVRPQRVRQHRRHPPSARRASSRLVSSQHEVPSGIAGTVFECMPRHVELLHP